MDKDHIIPDVIDRIPDKQLEVKYGNIAVSMGQILTPGQVKNMPEVNWIAEPEKFYTLAMVDPDAPSRSNPKFREWEHWLVINIPGGNVAAGKVLCEYVGASPPEGTDLHRYVFLVFRQKKMLNCDEPTLTSKSGKGRAKFHIREFSQKYGLGDPIAGNYFKAKFV